MKVKSIVFVLVAVLLILVTAPVHAQEDTPSLPHAFYGEVEINGDPAPVGTEVEARGEGVQTGINGNPIITTVAGQYGSSDPLAPKLVVQGNIAEGTTLTFYVNGVATGYTAEWYSGEVTELDLAVTIEGPLPGTTDLSGIINNTGLFSQTINAGSSDGLCRLTIYENTVGLTQGGEPLSEIRIVKMGAPPAPPPGAYIVGSVYDLKPDGATFDPAVTIECAYEPSSIPQGVAENELVLVWWDAGASKWVELESTVNSDANTVMALISHFTAFATLAYGPPEPVSNPATFSLGSLIISPEEVTLGESVTISVEVINTGDEAGSYEVTLKIDGVVEASEDITVSAGAGETATFTAVKDLPGTYLVDVNGLSGTFMVMEETLLSPPAPPSPPAAPAGSVNWSVLWGVIGGVVMAGLVIFLLARRKTY